MASGLNVYLKLDAVYVSMHGETCEDIYVTFNNLNRPNSKVSISLHNTVGAGELAATLRKQYDMTAEFSADVDFTQQKDTVVFVQVRVEEVPSAFERIIIFNSCDTGLSPCNTVVFPLSATDRDTICNWIVRTYEYAQKTLYDVDNMAEDCDV